MKRNEHKQPNWKERIKWNSMVYEPNYWKILNKNVLKAILIVIIALPIGTAWMGIPPIFNGTIKMITSIAYTMGVKVQ